MSKMTLVERIRRRLKRSKEAVFVRADFDRLGGYDQVGRALRELMEEGTLVRSGYGVYVKAEPSVLTGRPIPALPLTDIGMAALSKLGIKAELGSAAQKYMKGETTQFPMTAVLSVGKSRITRKLSMGNNTLRFER